MLLQPIRLRKCIDLDDQKEGANKTSSFRERMQYQSSSRCGAINYERLKADEIPEVMEALGGDGEGVSDR